MQLSRLTEAIALRLAVIGPDDAVATAALLLSTPRIGLVLVCGSDGRTQGVLSKSDLIRHIADPEPAPGQVGRLMTRDVLFRGIDDDMHETWRFMSARRLQNLPILDSGQRPVGVLDIRDAMQALLEEEEMEEKSLRGYIAGAYSG